MFDHVPDMQFKVVKNHEEQYSIWPDFKELPPGWEADGKVGTKEECLAHIKDVWVDMRPRSLRDAVAAELQSQEA